MSSKLVSSGAGGGSPALKLNAPTTTLATQLITALKKRNTMGKKFKDFIASKDLGPQPITYFVYYDIDYNQYKIASEYDITFNCIVLQKGFVPSKHDKKSEKSIVDYQYEWEY